jgi:hypothetical protein
MGKKKLNWCCSLARAAWSEAIYAACTHLAELWERKSLIGVCRPRIETSRVERSDLRGKV